MGGGRKAHVQAEHITATHCWPPSVSQSKAGPLGKGHQQPQQNGALGLPVNHELVEDISHLGTRPLLTDLTRLSVCEKGIGCAKGSLVLITVQHQEQHFGWLPPDINLNTWMYFLRVTALSSDNREVSRHLQKAISTSRQVKTLAFQWQLSYFRYSSATWCETTALSSPLSTHAAPAPQHHPLQPPRMGLPAQQWSTLSNRTLANCKYK